MEKREGGVVKDEKGGGEHLMRLLGFNQYGIWLEDDWKTNLIWEAIRLSFITQALSLSLRWICLAPVATFSDPIHIKAKVKPCI